MHCLVRACIVVTCENSAASWLSSASRQGGALVLEDLLEDVAQDCLRVIGVRHMLAHTQDVAAFADVVLNIIVRTLVS